MLDIFVGCEENEYTAHLIIVLYYLCLTGYCHFRSLLDSKNVFLKSASGNWHQETHKETCFVMIYEGSNEKKHIFVLVHLFLIYTILKCWDDLFYCITINEEQHKIYASNWLN